MPSRRPDTVATIVCACRQPRSGVAARAAIRAHTPQSPTAPFRAGPDSGRRRSIGQPRTRPDSRAASSAGASRTESRHVARASNRDGEAALRDPSRHARTRRARPPRDGGWPPHRCSNLSRITGGCSSSAMNAAAPAGSRSIAMPVIPACPARGGTNRFTLSVCEIGVLLMRVLGCQQPCMRKHVRKRDTGAD